MKKTKVILPLTLTLIEMRSLITLYKDDDQVKGVSEKLEQVALAEEEKEDSDVEEDFPDVHVDELE